MISLKNKSFLSFVLCLVLCLVVHSSQARETLNINSDWQVFAPSAGSVDDAVYRSLPHYWSENTLSQFSQNRANYARSIYAPFHWQLGLVYIKFHGAGSVVELFVNGRYVGEHRGGATAFLFDITRHLRYGEDNTIFVSVNAAHQSDILPSSQEQVRFGGIYGDVEIISTSKVAIDPNFYGADGVFVTTQSIDGNSIQAETRLHFTNEESVERDVLIKVIDNEDNLVFSRRLKSIFISRNDPLSIPFEIKRGKPWSPSSPSMYDVIVRLEPLNIENEENLSAQSDEVSVRTGFRLITIPDADASKLNLSVNGKAVNVRGVTLQHDAPSEGEKTNKRQLERDLNLVRDMGATAIRSVIAPHSPFLYKLCDDMGMLVWIDTPLSRAPFLSDIAYYPTPRFEQNGIQQMKEIIYQNYNHPSVMMWGIFSLLKNQENSGVATYVRTLNNTAKECDPTRPTVALSNQNGDFNSISDLIVWQQNVGWERGDFSDIGVWSSQLHRNWGHFRSAVMYGEQGNVEHQSSRGHKVDISGRWRSEARQSEMHETYAKHLDEDEKFWGVWLSSMFDYRSPRSHTGINYKGVVSFDRREIKDAYYLYRALWNTESPTLHIAQKRARLLGESPYTLRVYSSNNIDPVMLHLRDTIMAMKKIAPSQYVLDGIKVSGSVTLRVHQKGLSDSLTVVGNSPLRAYEH